MSCERCERRKLCRACYQRAWRLKNLDKCLASDARYREKKVRPADTEHGAELVKVQGAKGWGWAYA